MRNISALDKECREEFPQQHSIMFVVLVQIHLRISRRATELRLFLSGIIQRQSSWNDRMLQEWIMKKKPLSANKMKQKAILGYFHWLNALSPMGDCVGWGSLTQCWPARPGQWWILSKGTFNKCYICFCWQGAQNDNSACLQPRWVFEDSHTLAFLWLIKRIC